MNPNSFTYLSEAQAEQVLGHGVNIQNFPVQSLLPPGPSSPLLPPGPSSQLLPPGPSRM